MRKSFYILFGVVVALSLGLYKLNENELRLGDGTDTNKVIEANTSSADKPSLRYDVTSSAWQFSNNGTDYAAMGSGGGLGVNHITNPDFELNATDWNLFAEGAVSAPATGTGGSAGITFTRTTTASEVLRGGGSGKISKPASDQQGDGVSSDLDLDLQDVQKLLGIQFEYSTSANYVDGDLGVWMICDTGGTPIVIEPQEGSAIPATGGGRGKMIKSWLAPENDDETDCRLSYMIPNTNALAWDVLIDDVQVGPGVSKTTPVVGDWVTFIPTYFNTPPSLDIESGAWRRVGDTMEIKVTLRGNGGGSPSGNLQIAFPSGLNPDAGSLPSAAGGYATVGSAIYRDVGANESIAGNVVIDTGTSKFLFIFPGTAAFTGWSQLGSANDVLSFVATVPIAEWKNEGVTHLLDGDVPAQNSKAKVYGVATTSIPATNPYTFDFDTVKYNDGGGLSFDGSGTFTVKRDGRYRVEAQVAVSGSIGTATILRIQTQAGTVAERFFLGTSEVIFISAENDFNAGDEIFIQKASASTFTAFDTQRQTYFTVTRLPDITAGTPIGFGLASSGTSGLYTPGNTNGYSGTTAISEGKMGHVETITDVSSAATCNGSWQTFASKTLDNGVWLLDGSARYSSAVSLTNLDFSVQKSGASGDVHAYADALAVYSLNEDFEIGSNIVSITAGPEVWGVFYRCTGTSVNINSYLKIVRLH